MNWDDPAERARLIERVGPKEYNRLIAEEHKRQTLVTVNGYGIRRVNSGRFGTIFMIDGAGVGYRTLKQATEEAAKLPQNPKGNSNK